jgi:hypothetical protein
MAVAGSQVLVDSLIARWNSLPTTQQPNHLGERLEELFLETSMLEAVRRNPLEDTFGPAPAHKWPAFPSDADQAVQGKWSGCQHRWSLVSVVESLCCHSFAKATVTHKSLLGFV